MTKKTVMGSDDSMLAGAVTPDLPLFILRRQLANGSKQEKKNINRLKMFVMHSVGFIWHQHTTLRRHCVYCSILLTAYEAKAATHDTTNTS